LNTVTKKGTIVPIMSTMAESYNLSAALFGKTRRAILSLLYSHADESFYLRQIARFSGTGLGAMQRELKQLSAAGIIRRTVRGKRVYYQANPECPIFTELKSLTKELISNDDVSQSLLESADGGTSKGGREMRKGIVVPKKEVADFCQRNHIRKLSLFGSVLRGDFRPDSDVDVLVEFEPGRVPGFFRLFDMETELSSLFGGHKVDLHTPGDLSRYFRDEVIATAELQYAQ